MNKNEGPAIIFCIKPGADELTSVDLADAPEWFTTSYAQAFLAEAEAAGDTDGATTLRRWLMTR